MILGRDFVWLHFPKCAGHAVDQALRGVLRGRSEIVFDDQAREAGWHDSVDERLRREPMLDFSNRRIICGFRRLPHWILSRIHYEASRPPYLCATREMLCRGEFFGELGDVGKADDFAAYYAAGKVERWVRTEHLAEDFERHFGDMLEAPLARAAVRRLRKIVNGARLNYVRSPGFYFTAAELDALYEANPVWAALERELYGDTLSLHAHVDNCAYFVDRQMRFVAATPGALDLWGKTTQEIVGRRLIDVFPAAVDSEPYRAQLQALAAREPMSFATYSPTFDQPVDMHIHPYPRGLQVSFALMGAA